MHSSRRSLCRISRWFALHRNALVTSLSRTFKSNRTHLLERKVSLYGWVDARLDFAPPPAAGCRGCGDIRRCCVARAYRGGVDELLGLWTIIALNLSRVRSPWESSSWSVVEKRPPACERTLVMHDMRLGGSLARRQWARYVHSRGTICLMFIERCRSPAIECDLANDILIL